MNFIGFFGKKEWYSIFLASLIFVLFFGLCLFSKIILWVFFIISVLGLIISVYMAFFHKYKDDNNELDEMLNGLQDMFKSQNISDNDDSITDDKDVKKS